MFYTKMFCSDERLIQFFLSLYTPWYFFHELPSTLESEFKTEHPIRNPDLNFMNTFKFCFTKYNFSSDSYLVELHTREDFNAFQAYIFNLMDDYGKSTGLVATGAEVVSFTNDTLGIVWGHSKAPVDVSEHGQFKPSLGYYWNVNTVNFLMLQPTNFIKTTYLGGNPTFYLYPWLYNDGSYEFACMRDGKTHSVKGLQMNN